MDTFLDVTGIVKRARRAEVIVSLLAASIYLAYKIYISCV